VRSSSAFFKVAWSRQRALRLLKRDLIGPGVDLGQEIPPLHRLALGEVHVGEIAAELRADDHAGERRHRAQSIEADREIAGFDRGRQDRDDARTGRTAIAPRAGLSRVTLILTVTRGVAFPDFGGCAPVLIPSVSAQTRNNDDARRQ